MGKVIKDFFFTLGGVERQTLIESIEPNFELEIQESRPADGSGAVRKDAGLENNSIQATIVDDDALTLTTYLQDNAGTKVAFAFRYENAAESATNRTHSGTVIIPRTVPPANQGELTRYQVNFQIDGAVTVTP